MREGQSVIACARETWLGGAALAGAARYSASVVEGESVSGALEALAAENLHCTPFQRVEWLRALYQHVAGAENKQPRLVVVRDVSSNKVVLALPLVVERIGGRSTAYAADLGVSDYNAPMLAKALSPPRAQEAWCAAEGALGDVGMIRLERMPAEIGGVANPLAQHARSVPAVLGGNIVSVEGSVDDYVRARGKKYRKEVERCNRLWQAKGTVRVFGRARTQAEIDAAYGALQAQQEARSTKFAGDYALDRTAYRAFYAQLLRDGQVSDFCQIFTLKNDGEIVGSVLGVLHEGSFTLLRVSTAAESWGYLSPGRLVILEVMRHFVAQGVRRFDLGIGSYPFKKALGAVEIPLTDLCLARSLGAVPRAALYRVKGRLRQNERLRALVRRFRA